ncbi:MAG: acyl-CoA/acyl-ACP dehydrogenase [Pseudomonadales bacterium]|nr:acyl-CoA/acyl-ACP dehydrogenase [Halioglobus sp.]MCP5194761.1 acyl-CoA/acyl-ACP dehydrogenase [Pseudomonadales bacterium]
MDFSITADQLAIRELAHQIFTDRTTDEFMLAFDRGDDVYDDALWATLAEQGLLGITVPEGFGGTGLGFTELCLVLEEQGRRISPIPLYSSLVLGALPIAEFGSDKQKEKYLAPLAAGTLKLTAAIAELGVSEAAAGLVSAVQKGDTWTLNGALQCVPDSPVANAIIVPASTEYGQTLFIIDTDITGLTIDAQTSSLGANEGNISLADVELDATTVLGAVGEGAQVMQWLELRAETAICALQLGVTEEALKRTAEYTCERKQFGAAIGSFQAVAMQAADAFIDVEAIRSTYWLALYKLESGQDARAEVRCAKWFASDAGHRIVYRTQHLHGGMGADLEYPIHRFFLWAKHLGLMLGGGSVQIAKLGALLASDDSVGLAALQI